MQNYINSKIDIQISHNDNNLTKEAKSKDKKLIVKIANYLKLLTSLERQDKQYTVDNILNILASGKPSIFRTIFRKNPTKQSIHEKTQTEIIRKYKYKDAIKPQKPIYFYYNSTKTKSIDLISEKYKVLCVLKYTSGAGGTQDYAYADVLSFIKYCFEFMEKNPEWKLELFLDGDYYTKKCLLNLQLQIPKQFSNRIILSSAEKLLQTVN